MLSEDGLFTPKKSVLVETFYSPLARAFCQNPLLLSGLLLVFRDLP